MVSKVGLNIANNKTGFIANIRDASDSIPLGDTVIGKTNSVKYLGDNG